MEITKKSRHLTILAVFWVIVATAQAAVTTGFNQTAAGPWDYNSTSNWVGSNINGVWDPALTLTANQTATFAADTTLTTGLSFNYGGTSKTLALIAAAAGTVNLTLGGDVAVNTAGGTTANITIGSTTNHLKINLGGVPRTMMVAASRSLTILDVISNGGIIKTGPGTLTLGNSANLFSGWLVITNGTVADAYTTVSNTSFGTGTIYLGDTTPGNSNNATLQTNNNGGSMSNPIIVQAGSSGTLTIQQAPNGQNGNFSGSVTLNNNLTVASPSYSGAKGLNLSGAIDGTGNITLSTNAGSASVVTLSGSSINHSGTITNLAAGTGIITISGKIGSNVSGVTQNSATAKLVLTGANNFTGGLNIRNGTTSLNNATAASTATITLGDGSGTNAATLLAATATSTTFANAITIAAGSSGTIALAGTGASNNPVFSGGIAVHNDLTIYHGTSGGTVTCNGLVTADANAHVITASANNTAFNGGLALGGGELTLTSSGGKLTIAGSLSGTGDLTLQNNSTTATGITLAGNNINHAGTITNSGNGSGSVLISGVCGANVTAINQNSRTSALLVTGALDSNIPVTVAAGAVLGGSGTIAGPVTLAAAANLAPSAGLGGTRTLTLSNGSAAALSMTDSVLTSNIASSATPATDLVAINGTLVLNGTNIIALVFPDSFAPAGTYTLLTYSAITGNGTLALNAHYPNTTLNVGPTSVTLTVTGSGTYSPQGLLWKGNLSGIWDTTTANWLNDGVAAIAPAGAAVTFDDDAASFAVTCGGVAPGNVFFFNNSNNYIFSGSGGGIGGTSSLTKYGAGALTLNGSNNFTGTTTINGGRVVVGDAAALAGSSVTLNTAGGLGFAVNTATLGGLAGAGGIGLNNGSTPVALTVGANNSNTTYGGDLTGTGSLVKTGTGVLTLTGSNMLGGATVANGTLVVNGSLTAGAILVNSSGILTGTGSINGPVAVGAGGTLTPVANWVLKSTLSLGSGSTTAMQLGTGASMIRGGTTLTYGGTLMVTNVGASLTAGSSFKLFDAATYAGAFSATSLPTLGTGLKWHLADLPLNGTIRVVPLWSVAAAFASNMVLQRGMPVPVWGSAEPGLTVTVDFGGQTKTTAAGADRKWLVRLDALAANINPQSLTVTIQGVTPVVFTNVVVGEVWLASGQSNMDGGYTGVGYVTNSAAEIAAANYPLIRSMKVGRTTAVTPVWDVSNQWSWTACSPATVSSWSGTAYFFARALFQNINVPIGIVESAYGGTLAEAWTSTAALNAVPELKTYADQQMGKYYQGTLNSKDAPSGLFNAMISPLVPFAVRGAIWYQGEQNSSAAQQYRVLLPTLIQDWRNRWQQTELPFYIVQLPNYSRDGNYPYLREAQLLTLQSTSNTGLAITIDVGDPNNIHPTDKQDVGVRLANLALNRNYGFVNVVPSGPVFRSATSEGSQIRIAFDYADGGLMTGNKNVAIPLDQVQELVGIGPSWFEIAGADQVFVAATANIDGANNTVVVSSPVVPMPTLVRYAWAANPLGNNLYNRAGLPASPFRTPATISAAPPPTIQLNNGMVELGCAVPNNVTGWVEFTDNLTTGSWAPLDVPQTGTGTTQSITTPITNTPRRFYRWHLVP